MKLHLLSAGAAQGLARAIEPVFAADTGAALAARFGAVGAMLELFRSDDACDVIVLTAAMIDELAATGQARGETRAALGRVRTGIAVREGDAAPDVETPDALRAALLAADAVYLPDPVKSTAGIHFAKVLRELGIDDALRDRLRAFPNGAAAMRELAASTSARPIGCTQHTEILYTPGVRLVAPLPPQFELATTYVAAVTARAADAVLAERFVHALAGPASQALRAAGGFED
ncbi:MAG TPA: substrate-binding domain-containing protein [Burkholderiaceae bacterium]|nr:substrate-binding domain-containing protein [Burkholderiaceae bacterium]